MKHIYLAVFIAAIHCFADALQQEHERLTVKIGHGDQKTRQRRAQVEIGELPRYARPVAQCSSYKKTFEAGPKLTQKSSSGSASAIEQVKGETSVSLQDSAQIPSYARALARTQAYRKRGQSMTSGIAVGSEQKSVTLPESARSQTKATAGQLASEDIGYESPQLIDAFLYTDSSHERGFAESKRRSGVWPG
ncbi:hypothetical protein M514_09551 [Trichuris suis]|uniref:Uncharacterized protein n=1 Tax=Trichuris suis TaxID=68888 RepID=A0A085NL26_9BILA|nr:hypothetical protein M513_09551 [Trichuris suis]KFD70172.1 hypothetical protein M514_09551 [Trichuris suis]KHJ40723.1 hypothetical protein D918_09243 [Trichuris suis]